jgi:DNA-binding HxlR family transcriptional regulator
VRGPCNCPVELALDLLGGKWRVVILAHVKQGAQRYSDLRRAVPRMSEKMLTQRLRQLEESGLLARRSGAYSLTARGESARSVLDALYSWGEAVARETGVAIVPPASLARAPRASR